MIHHKFDTMPLILTIPSIGQDDFFMDNEQLSLYKQQKSIKLLSKIKQVISVNSNYVLKANDEQNKINQKYGGMVNAVDKTSKYTVGKFLLEIGDLEKFEWYGENQNLYIRVTCYPYVLYSKRISKKPKIERTNEFSEVDKEQLQRHVFAQKFS